MLTLLVQKYTSVRNGGIQRRSPKRGGVYAGPKIYEKVVTNNQICLLSDLSYDVIIFVTYVFGVASL